MEIARLSMAAIVSVSPLPASLGQITAAGMPGVIAATDNSIAASGVADVDTGRKMRPHFKHRMGSITKTFTATVALQLVGEGRLQLEAPVSRYLPQYDTGGVTVRMLLNHTSGIGDFDTVIFQTPQDLVRHRYTTFTPDELARLGLGAPPTNPPGAAWSYSNTNYVLLGMIIAEIAGRPAQLELYRRIVVPLGLWHTYFAGATTRILGPHSEAYIPWYGGELKDFSVYNMSWAWMLGDMVSTTADVNEFFEALLTGKLLRPAQLAQMRTTVPFDPALPQAGGYGLGIYTIPLPCGDVWGHDGVVFGHSAISLHAPDASRQFTLGSNMTNYAAPGEPDPIAAATGQAIVTALCPAARTSQPYHWRSPLPALTTSLN